MRNTVDAEDCVLVLVDYQQRLMPAIQDSQAVLAEALCLADIARELGVRVVGTEQNPEGLGASVEAIRERCEFTVPKMRFDACADGLLERLRCADRALPGDVVIAGCEAHVCLMQTALGLLRAGVRVWVVGPACGSRRASDHALAMERLRHAGAAIASAETIAFEWLRDCRHERFRPVLARLKARSP